ncbi:MAG: flagellar hook-basal body complex protein FliE [Rickettsiaceae bacterium]|nr:flagellar hook-basal body complex protein FliE [Rickettsiaceae bacterium]MDP5021215.1 flagellar hook-basal body complex protein FliE [Rickettsiaceae bacterium]MDP5083442.1 flagellar hook-basal body complex protein FliE [Rickettsiaceae bacterium]
MSIDSIGLLAQQSYTQIQDRPKLNVTATPISNAVNFHDVVNRQFNSFASMSPAQILNHIQAKQTGGATTIGGVASSSGLAGSATNTLRSAVAKQEQTARKSLIGEASLVELLTTTTEAKNVMDTTVRVRDKFLEAFDKVMNMSM